MKPTPAMVLWQLTESLLEHDISFGLAARPVGSSSYEIVLEMVLSSTSGCRHAMLLCRTVGNESRFNNYLRDLYGSSKSNHTWTTGRWDPPV